ncbi:hypothetical protein I8748_22445 [Nostoc sp. CENA67]|uniref:Uncharacterized protein n=1 Tax=Amazonocrinis nigriterrae CENA67 TaxID=2794033 RepID=A0A8J7L9X9_9NOST|nr:hypothetical protein [Amazonocrinis nigriterrae]MBH8564908.1 hypothetical protein [Amazonocrinis nigriterrae CENA67]
MNTSRQISQPQSPLVLEYSLLHNGKQDSPANINLVRRNPDLCDFYEVDIRYYDL